MLSNSIIRSNYCFQISRGLSSFKHSDLKIAKTSNLKPKPDWNQLAFGHQFSDHMLQINWSLSHGWSCPQIHEVKDFKLHPAAKVFHYAPEIFEGMKAYFCSDKNVRLFRPQENMKRMNISASRSCLPNFDGDEFLKCLKTLIHIDRDWVPTDRGKSLYIRPTLIGTDPTLGVTAPTESILYVILSPVGAYFPTGIKPVTLMADPRYVRAWHGGAGDCKLGANYAPTVSIQSKALSEGCQQVLWLYGKNELITEVGTMNFFLYWKNEAGERELITPPLDGLILPGITRKSIIELASQWSDITVHERDLTMAQLLNALSENRVEEMFGAGTACTVCPIERIKYQGSSFDIPTMTNGAKLTMRLLKELNDIQYGEKEPHPWTEVVEC